MLRFFDSHVHLTDPDMVQDIKPIMERAHQAHVVSFGNICTTLEELEKGKEWQKMFPHWVNIGATPPHTVHEDGEKEFSGFAQAALAHELAAIGETGLDYHLVSAPKKTQQEFLIRYLHLAKKVQKPVVFHCRNAFDDLFAIADEEYTSQGKAILHCFTGTWEEAKKALDRGWYISFSGIVTFKKSTELQEIARKIPLEHLLIETDAPFLAPQSRRGKKNEPAFLVETAEKIGYLQGVSVEKIAEATYQNGEKLFF